MARNVDKLAKQYPGTTWHSYETKYVGVMGNRVIAFNKDDVKKVLSKNQNSAQDGVNRAIAEMKAKTWNSKEAN
jgi:hypothetical protein